MPTLFHILLFNQAATSAATIIITICMLFFGKIIHRVVDKSTSFVAEDGLDTRNHAEIMIRFVGVYFLWGILAQLCISLYSAIMLARFQHAPRECAELVSKNEMLSQHLKNPQSNLTANYLIGLIVLTGLAYYFLKRGKLVIDLFHHRWLPGKTQPPAIIKTSNSDSSPSDSN